MNSHTSFRKRIVRLLIVFGLLSIAGLLLSVTTSLATSSAPAPGQRVVNAAPAVDPALQDAEVPEAPCAGGPVLDGVTLDECFDESFTVGGTTKTVRVWYTNVVSTVQRTVDGTTYNLTHYVNNDAEAQDVARWGERPGSATGNLRSPSL